MVALKHKMRPIVSIVGKSESGKTTLLEGLISELKSRGYRVASVKHASRGIALDKPGKDSWRHIQAGSEATAIGFPEQIVLIKPVTHNPSLDEIVRLFDEDYDIILAEGFKWSNAPKIQVHRKKTGPLLSGIRNLIAIATDEPLEVECRQFSLQDFKGIADLLEYSFLKPQNKGTSHRS